MTEIRFVLKDDDTYDAWIKKAEELKFQALDDICRTTTSASGQSIANQQHITKQPSSNDKSSVSRESQIVKSIDGSTTDSAQKSVKSDRKKSAESSSPNPSKSLENQENASNKEDENRSNDNEKTNKAR